MAVLYRQLKVRVPTHGSSQDVTHSLDQKSPSDICEYRHEARICSIFGYRLSSACSLSITHHPVLGSDFVARIYPFAFLNQSLQAHTRHFISAYDCPLYRRGASPSWQE